MNLQHPQPSVPSLPSLPQLPLQVPPLRAMFTLATSPHPGSALFASPHLLPGTVEVVTPDRAVPFQSSDDLKGLALPRPDVNVVREEDADRAFGAIAHTANVWALPSPEGLACGTFSGSSNLPTPNLSQGRLNHLASRPSPPPPFGRPSPPPLFSSGSSLSMTNMTSMTNLICPMRTPPPLGTFGLSEPELPPRPPVAAPAAAPPAAWPAQYDMKPQPPVMPPAVPRPRDDPASSASTLVTEVLPASTDSDSSTRGSPHRTLHASLKPRTTVAKRSKAFNKKPTCDMCGAHFARRSNLYKHKRSVHVDTRQYKCDICGYGFKRQDHLVKHKRSVHSKERNFPCEICGTAFAEKYNRAKHVRVIHYTQRPFQCACGAYHQHRDQMLGCLRCRR